MSLKAKGLQSLGKAVGERTLGLGPGPMRAAVAAAITGTATAVLTYRVLRSESGTDD